MAKNLLVMMLFLVSFKSNAAEWPYLKSKPFSFRQWIALGFTCECDTIVEIGGGQTPIDQFVTNKKIIVVDPQLKRKEEKDVLYIPKTFQDWKPEISSTNYAVLLLGLDLQKMDIKDWHKLYALLDASKKVVVEFSATNKSARAQFRDICKSINKKPTIQAQFDLSKSLFPQCPEVFPERVIACFE